MLLITYKTKGIRIGHACFITSQDIINKEYKKEKCDLLYLYGINDVPKDGKYLRSQHTLMKDLSLTEDMIYNSFGKSLRKHIKRGLKNENISIKVYSPNDLNMDDKDSILNICKMLFERMYASKGRNVVFNMKMAKALIQKGYLHIPVAYYNNCPIGFCAILVQGTNARRWISSFDFRNNPELSQIYSDAHKRLDWDAMKYCKRIGVTQLDLGGINSYTEPNGIARFKLEFERNNVITYKNYVVPASLIGKIALMYMEVKNKIQ